MSQSTSKATDTEDTSTTIDGPNHGKEEETVTGCTAMTIERPPLTFSGIKLASLEIRVRNYSYTNSTWYENKHYTNQNKLFCVINPGLEIQTLNN
jgi:hypothetical protein